MDTNSEELKTGLIESKHVFNNAINANLEKGRINYIIIPQTSKRKNKGFVALSGVLDLPYSRVNAPRVFLHELFARWLCVTFVRVHRQHAGTMISLQGLPAL